MPRCDYELIDSGNGRKLERFGPCVLARPAAPAVWPPFLPAARWAAADASFDRADGPRWKRRTAMPDPWIVEIDGLRFRLSGTDFGHLGLFPEQRDQWAWIRQQLGAASRMSGRRPAVLNLFAYSGGATLAALAANAEVCHVDASRGMVEWARENAGLNGWGRAPVRWIVDDAHKFLRREIRRGHRYDAIVCDPPTFGRGPAGEVYKIERDLAVTVEMCRAVLSDAPLFFLLSGHTPGLTPQGLANVLIRFFGGDGGRIEHGEMLLRGGAGVAPLPSGAWARWRGPRGRGA